jgi:lipopolysaccharide transport system permease protein
MEVKAQQSTPVHVYTPEAGLHHPLVLLRGMFTDIGASRTLAWSLATRDLRAQYRGSVLGFLWAFITPLVSTALWLFLSATGVVKLADTGMPYALYVFSGTMLWQVFVEALNSPLQQVNAARAMLTKLNVPREAVVLAGFIKVLVNAGVKLLLLLAAVLAFGVRPDAHLVLVPAGLVVLASAGLSLGLLLTPVGMLYSDVGRSIPLLAQLLMYLSPVLFAIPTTGLFAAVYRWNPMSPLILNTRAWLTGMDAPQAGYYLVVVAGIAVLLLLGWVLYRITMPILIEHLN